MGSNAIYELFLEMERKYDMLSDNFSQSGVWKFVRTEVMRILIEREQNMCVTMSGTESLQDKKETLLHKYKVNPYTACRKDILFIGLGRRNWNGFYYEDPVLDPLCEKLTYSYYIYEYPYGRHFEPVNNGNVKYLDRFKCPIETDEKKKKETREINDYIINVIESELKLFWTNNEKERLCRYIYFLLNTLDTNFRLFAGNILKKVNPKVVVIVNAPDMMNMIIIQEAKKKNIPVVELAHGIMSNVNVAYNFYKKTDLDTNPDYILVYGEYDKKIANYSIESKNIIPVGYPILEKKAQTIQVEKDNRVCITFFAGANILLGKYVKYLTKKLDGQKYKIIFKLHPHQYNSWRKLYSGLDGLSNLEIIDNNQTDAYYYLINSDYVIGISTTVLFEATFYSKKIGIIKTEDNRPTQDLYLNGYAKLIENEEQLLNFVTGQDDFVPKQGEYFKKNATQNINKVIQKIIEDGKIKERTE